MEKDLGRQTGGTCGPAEASRWTGRENQGLGRDGEKMERVGENRVFNMAGRRRKKQTATNTQ